MKIKTDFAFLDDSTDECLKYCKTYTLNTFTAKNIILRKLQNVSALPTT